MKKRMKLIVLLVALLTIGGISAYFVDKDTIQNTFTVGSVDIFLDEPNWEEEDKVFPNQTLPKDPQVTNVGDNDAYIFVEVEVPYATVRTESTNGIVSPAKEQELFTYDVNEGWVEIISTKDEEKGVVTHVYAYMRKQLKGVELNKYNFYYGKEYRGIILDTDLEQSYSFNSDGSGTYRLYDVWDENTNTGINVLLEETNFPAGTFSYENGKIVNMTTDEQVFILNTPNEMIGLQDVIYSLVVESSAVYEEKVIALKPDATTKTVFDTITFINVIDGEANLENSIQKVVVTAKAIQTNDLDGATTPEEIYKVLNDQGPTSNCYISPLNEYGFYFGESYIATSGKWTYVYQLYEDGSFDFYRYRNGVLDSKQAAPAGSLLYKENTANRLDIAFTISTDGTKLTDYYGDTYTLSSTEELTKNEYGFYFDKEYILIPEEGVKVVYIFHEDGSNDYYEYYNNELEYEDHVDANYYGYTEKYILKPYTFSSDGTKLNYRGGEFIIESTEGLTKNKNGFYNDGVYKNEVNEWGYQDAFVFNEDGSYNLYTYCYGEFSYESQGHLVNLHGHLIDSQIMLEFTNPSVANDGYSTYVFNSPCLQ